jgi:hypothetical protein
MVNDKIRRVEYIYSETAIGFILQVLLKYFLTGESEQHWF